MGLQRVGHDLACPTTTTNTCFNRYLYISLGFHVAQTVKNLPAVQKSRVGSVGWEDPLAEGMATHSSILAWRVPWAKEPGGLQSVGSRRVGHD